MTQTGSVQGSMDISMDKSWAELPAGVAQATITSALTKTNTAGGDVYAHVVSAVNEKRRMQSGGAALTVKFHVKCHGSCDDVHAMLSAQMGNQEYAQALIEAINSMAAAAGFADAVVLSSAADIAATIALPTIIDITLPPAPPVTDCEDQADLQVAAAWCNQQGGPQQSTTAMCIAETSDSAAILALCNTIGVLETGRVACSGLGYPDATCDVVAGVVADSFANCEILAANAPAVCPDLAALTTDANCDDWAAREGRMLGLGQNAILQMAPHMESGDTFQDYCQSVGSPAAATNMICNSVPADAAMQACPVSDFSKLAQPLH